MATTTGNVAARIGAYELLGLIAEGGMGAVFAARHRITGHERALKVVRSELSRDPEFVERFLREVRLASSIRHDNLVQFFEPGMEGDTVFLPMELLHGETLASLLERAGRLSVKDAAAIMLCICRGVAAVHAHNVLHRDLKPLNVFLAFADGGRIVPKVLDFGTARDYQDSEQTRTGIVIGSPYYMAPEQASGVRNLDHRVDQFALGVMCYEMLAGRRPYEEDDSGHALAKLLRADPFPNLSELNPDVPVALATVIHRAIARDPADRFPSVAYFAVALAAAADVMGTDPGLEGGGLGDTVRDATPADALLGTVTGGETAEGSAAATQLIENLEASCIIEVEGRLAAPASLATAEATRAIASLADSCVIEVQQAAPAPPPAPVPGVPVGNAGRFADTPILRIPGQRRTGLWVIVGLVVLLIASGATVLGAVATGWLRGNDGTAQQPAMANPAPSPAPSPAAAAPASAVPAVPQQVAPVEPPPAAAASAEPAPEGRAPEGAAPRHDRVPERRTATERPGRGAAAATEPRPAIPHVAAPVLPEEDEPAAPCVPTNGIPCID